MAQYTYCNRDLSWLSFNYRVLQEAKDESLPLYERIKFLAIYSNNLEEFYQVRVSYYRQLLENEVFPQRLFKEISPAAILKEINTIVSIQQAEFHDIFRKNIVPELRKKGIYLLEKGENLTSEQKDYIEYIFDSEVLSTIQPVLLVKDRIYPFLKSGQVYLALEMYNKDTKFRVLNKKRTKYGLIKLPTDHNITRFIELPVVNGHHPIIFLDDMIMHFVHKIFPGFIVRSWHSIKLTRDADLDYDEFEGEDLIKAISEIRAARSLGAPNRFLYFRDMPAKMLEYLTKTLRIDPAITVKGGTHHNFRDFFVFPNPFTPELEEPKLPRIRIPDFVNSVSIATAVNKRDYLLNVPYQTYDHLIQFLKQAAQDDSVEEIKVTQYRVASHSEVVDALMLAADNGKKVTVFVELKARFDEEANLNYAHEMKKAGIKIIYSIPYLKVHAKLALVIRKPGSKNKNQVFLGTGNFNEKTARLYGDHGLFTSHTGIVNDVIRFFTYLEDQNVKVNFDHILVPLFNMVEKFEMLIDKEIELAKKGKQAYIILKMNGLQDLKMVNKLYEASENGVIIDLIVRGVCILKTGQPYSRNIRVIRIIDRFLEHARVFFFNNGGDHIIYLGSADWMNRNLYRRIECDFPVYDLELKKELYDILQIQLQDNVKACLIDENMDNIRIKNNKPKIRAQLATYEYLKKKYSS
ncbi:MAG: polyphosphate kinase 1 [Bacteroidales bacterium]